MATDDKHSAPPPSHPPVPERESDPPSRTSGGPPSFAPFEPDFDLDDPPPDDLPPRAEYTPHESAPPDSLASDSGWDIEPAIERRPSVRAPSIPVGGPDVVITHVDTLDRQDASAEPHPISTLPPDAIQEEDDPESLADSQYEPIPDSAEAERLELEEEQARKDLVFETSIMLDRFDYLALLQLPPEEPTDRALRNAFHAFALAFHPDRFREADDDLRRAANDVYCRGGEAYRVLQDPLMRKRYMRMRARGKLRMPAEEIAQVARDDASATIESLAKSPAAVPFAKRADELIANGHLREAKLQLQLALSKERGNAHLEERMAELDEELAAGKK